MLELREVRVAYGPIEVLHGITLSVGPGEIACLLGANGAGKSTTVKTIAGLLRPSAGRITLGGERIDGLRPNLILKRGIALTPEGRRIFPQMTVRENLEMGAYVRRDPRALREDLEMVFSTFPVLRERTGQLGGSLSGGEQQMLAIGRALMSRPRLILFDEPSLGLAPTLVETTFRTIREIHERGTAVLMVEQNAFQALKMADRGYVMETGRIVLEGRAEDLLRDEHVRKAYLGG